MNDNNNINEKALRPAEDFAFKRLFGREDSKRRSMSLLNAILNGNPVIKGLKILNTETQIESRDNKASRLNKDWIDFFSAPRRIKSEDEGMKDVQRLWDRISADELDRRKSSCAAKQLKAQQSAQDKYQKDKESEIATARYLGKEEGLAEGLEKGEKN